MKIILVDLYNCFMVKWHAGATKHARWPFDETMGYLRALAQKYDHMAVMADGGKCFRGDLDLRWKANRAEKDQGAVLLREEVETALDAEGFHLFKVPEFEADDLIATAVRQLGKGLPTLIAGDTFEVVVHSSDKDLLGLLEPGVVMLTTTQPQRIVSADDVRTMAKKDGKPKFGVDPPKMRDWLLLADSHNGINYVEGIGPVHASRLLNQFGDLKSIIAALDNRVPDSDQFEVHPPSVRAALKKALADTIDGRPLLDVAIQVVTLRTDAPIDIRTIFEKKTPKLPREDPWEDESAGNAEVGGEPRRTDRTSAGMAEGNGTGGISDYDPAQDQFVGGVSGNRASGVRSAGGSDGGDPRKVASGSPTTNAQANTGGSHRVGRPVAEGQQEHTASLVQPVDVDPGASQAASAGAARETKALITAPSWNMALEPASVQQAWSLAKTAAASGFWRQHGNPEGCMMLILAGRSRGLTAFDALNGMHIIEGKPVFGAWLLIGMVQSHASVEYFELAENDDKHAVWIAKKKRGKREQKMIYTIEDAQRAQLVRETHNGKPSNWHKHPKDMLIKTAGAKLTRAAFAYITSGAVAAEEMGYE